MPIFPHGCRASDEKHGTCQQVTPDCSLKKKQVKFAYQTLANPASASSRLSTVNLLVCLGSSVDRLPLQVVVSLCGVFLPVLLLVLVVANYNQYVLA